MKCSGESSHALSVATAPAGNSRLDLPLFAGLVFSSLSSSEAVTLRGCGASCTSVIFFFLVVVTRRLLRRDGDGVTGVAEDELGDELQFCCSESLTIPTILVGGEKAVEADVVAVAVVVAVVVDASVVAADLCASVVVAMGKLMTVETSEVMNYQCRFDESPLRYVTLRMNA